MQTPVSAHPHVQAHCLLQLGTWLQGQLQTPVSIQPQIHPTGHLLHPVHFVSSACKNVKAKRETLSKANNFIKPH
ncbi:MAG: hypothetical protein P4L16_07640 [Chlamydiales bacterium]|nr:hypothetical protein [Chlamydiales bacterium]